MRSLRAQLPSVAVAVVIAFLGTINLWKVASLREFFPVDLTAASVALAVVAIAVPLVRRRTIWDRAWWPLVVGFGLFTPALLFTSLANPYSVSKTRELFTVCVLAAAAPMILLGTHRYRTAFMWVLAGLSLTISGWLLVAGAASTWGRGGWRIEDANPIAIGRMSAIGFVILVVVAAHTHGRKRAAAIAGVVLSATAMVLTESRGPIASAAVAIGVVVIMTVTGRQRIRRAIIVASAGAAGILAVTLLPLGRLSSAEGGASDVMRGRLAIDTLNVAWHHWGGVGWGDLAYHLSAATRIGIQGWVQYPHNVVLETAAEGGVLALVGLVAMLWVSWRRLYARVGTLTGQAMLGLWVMAVASAMTSSDLIGNRLMWMAIGVGLALPLSDRTPRRGGRGRHLAPRGR